jgi:hypothetical protein
MSGEPGLTCSIARPHLRPSRNRCTAQFHQPIGPGCGVADECEARDWADDPVVPLSAYERPPGPIARSTRSGLITLSWRAILSRRSGRRRSARLIRDDVITAHRRVASVRRADGDDRGVVAGDVIERTARPCRVLSVVARSRRSSGGNSSARRGTRVCANDSVESAASQIQNANAVLLAVIDTLSIPASTSPIVPTPALCGRQQGAPAAPSDTCGGAAATEATTVPCP